MHLYPLDFAAIGHHVSVRFHEYISIGKLGTGPAAIRAAPISVMKHHPSSCRIRAQWHGFSACVLMLVLTVAGCASFSPMPTDETAYLGRAETQVESDVSVTVAVPTAQEASLIFSADLARRQMQAVWLEVENRGSVPLWLMSSGIDPHYFSPAEAAARFGGGVETAREREAHFLSLAFDSPIMPGEAQSGFVLVNLDEGIKVVDIDLIGRGVFHTFGFVVPLPDFRGHSDSVDFAGLYADEEMVDFGEDEDAFQQALASLPCCTTNKAGTENGDPLNLVLIGETEDMFGAFARRGWHPVEDTWSGAIWKTVGSFLTGARYRYSPISPLYVYGRGQDVGAQKARGTIHQRNHLRLWLSPMRFRGHPVWVGQISRDIGVKYTIKSPTISTHAIDSDVDESRGYLLEDLLFSQSVSAFGYAAGSGAATPEAPRFNLTGDAYWSDGWRVVVIFGARPSALDNIEYLEDWSDIGAAEVPAID